MTSQVARSYRFLVPPGWTSLAIEQPGDDSLLTYVDAVTHTLPPERRASMRWPIVARLREMKRRLAMVGVTEVVLPVMDVDGWVPQASFAFARWTPEGEEGAVDTLIGIAARDASAQLMDIEGLVALRTSETVAVDAGSLDAYARDLLSDVRVSLGAAPAPDPGSAFSRRVVYYIGRADDSSAWLMATFSVVHAGDPRLEDVNEALVELFDTIMKSVRIW